MLFLAGFGSIWLLNGLTALHRLNAISLGAVVMILAVFAIPALRLLRMAGKRDAHAEATPEERQTRRVLLRVNATQGVAIIVSVWLLNAIHRGEFVAPVIAFIVGMHLFPLAELFNYAPYNVAGTLLVGWSTVAVTILPPELLSSIGALGTAIILLGSAAYTLMSASRAARATPSSPRLTHQTA
ncbi:hypothetical protein ACPOL_1960 [Acidisarcina polymorpha]|uniref:Uncharacterized protein n=1 Tax=Acidisarcina polymorpha TaxID=2211140 RepID=A0A2Z5FY47_9BACT|nr:hypothetical protein ACPOL_1960 [Acidisarcina polymorpha]